MKLNFNFESRENHFLTSGISHPGWYLSPRFTVPLSNDTVCRRIGDMTLDIHDQLIDRMKEREFSLQLVKRLIVVKMPT